MTGWILLLAMAATSAAPATELDLELPVVQVEVLPERVDGAAVAKVLGIEPGRPLDRARLRRGLQAMYAAEDVEHVRVEAEPTEGGLLLRVRVRALSRASALVVEAPTLLWRQRARRWFDLEPGDPVSAARVEAGVRRVRREARRRGFHEATAEAWLDYDAVSDTVAVTVVLVPGEVERLAGVIVVGLSEDEAAAVTPAPREGRQLTGAARDRLVRRVEAAVRRLGYWDARVDVGDSRTGPGGTTLTLGVDTGPRYRLDVVTADPGDAELVLDSFPDPGEEDLHGAQTAALAARVQERLQARGRPLATVSVELVATPVERTVRITADADRPRRITAVEIPGAAAIPEEELQAVVRVRPGRLGGWRGQQVTDRTLDTDRRLLLARYRQAGFADVEVLPARLEADGDDGLRVVLPVVEGPRWTIAEVATESFPAELLASPAAVAATSLAAAAWVPAEVEELRRTLETELLDLGYPEARVQMDTDSATPGQARIRFVAEPGPWVVIGEVVIAGLEHTSESVVRGRLERSQVYPGAPLSQSALREAQRRLYELGLFRRVEILPLPGQARQDERGLVVRLEEGDQKSYTLGLGWDTVDRFRVTLGWSHLNLFGGAHALSVEARLSSREQRWQVGLREPRVPWVDVPGYLVVYRTAEDFATYSQRRRGLWFEVGDRNQRPLRPWLRYEYQVQQPQAPDDVLSELERNQQEIRIASLTPTLELDTRDDLLRPERGLIAAASLEYAFPMFAADAEFLKLNLAGSHYRPVGRGLVAVGLRLGVIEPLAEVGDDPANLQLPLGVRYFAGGRTTHRAFATDQLGVPGQTLDESGRAIGGTAQLLLNLELERPLYRFLSGVLFVDAGNVWAEPATVDLDEVRWGVGAGLRVDTPAGPFRLEYGHKLDRRAGEPSGQWYLSFGVPF